LIAWTWLYFTKKQALSKQWKTNRKRWVLGAMSQAVKPALRSGHAKFGGPIYAKNLIGMSQK
jgi:hypothetical protein